MKKKIQKNNKKKKKKLTKKKKQKKINKIKKKKTENKDLLFPKIGYSIILLLSELIIPMVGIFTICASLIII